MTYNQKLLALLRDDSAVSAVVGNRVHIDFAKDDDLPYVTFFTVTDIQALYLDGLNKNTHTIRTQLDLWCETLTQMDSLWAAIQGLFPFSDAVAHIHIEVSLDNSEFAAEGSNKITRRKTIDLIAEAAASLT